MPPVPRVARTPKLCERPDRVATAEVWFQSGPQTSPTRDFLTAYGYEVSAFRHNSRYGAMEH